jgi:hypothetical protein
MRPVAAFVLLAACAAAQPLRIEKTDRVGRRVENEHFIADLSHRVVRGVEEDSGTIRALTYKAFGVTLLRTQNRMHWAPNLQREGASGYKGIGAWVPVQEFREERKAGEYVHYREGRLADYPEVRIEAEYRFFEGAPYFFFRSVMAVEKPLAVTLLRNNEMTMDGFFTHVGWPARDAKRHLTTFDERHAILQKEPIAVDAPWVVFVNLDKGYGFGFVNLESKATKTANASIGISDGAGGGKYWSRALIRGAATALEPGDRFEERTAYVLFRCSKESAFGEFFDWEKRIRARLAR